MQKLLSVPDNLVPVFHEITGKNKNEWFVSCDPENTKVGSGGGTANLLLQHKSISTKESSLTEYLNSGKKIIIHAGGQSRRLPAYAASGKILTPIPVFRWSQGQRIDQSLLDLQMPLLEKIMEAAGPVQNVLIAAGDILIDTPEVPVELMDADVVCFGMWADPHLASHHGVFFTARNQPEQLDFMIQKPKYELFDKLSSSHFYLIDIGIWILSNKAVELLLKKCGCDLEKGKVRPCFYDLYSSFGPCLGNNPANIEDISSLSVHIIPFNKGEFYHYGTSAELLSSTERIQNKIIDQRSIWHHRIKPHPSVFVQNAFANLPWTSLEHHVWIENSHIPTSWNLHSHHILTGIPVNEWNLNLKAGICIDMVPIGNEDFCIRIYHMEDSFRVQGGNESAAWMGEPVVDWFAKHEISFDEANIDKNTDIQSLPLFPLTNDLQIAEMLIKWMIGDSNAPDMRSKWLEIKRLSADEICQRTSLKRLFKQRQLFSRQNLSMLAANYKQSVFYQTDLKYGASEFMKAGFSLPKPLPEDDLSLLNCRDHMFRSEIQRLKGENYEIEMDKAFGVLRTLITSSAVRHFIPNTHVYPDQIVWARSPARLDLAGGWSDTPPYCMQNGGSVLNMAVELNGQPPIQVFIRLSSEPVITLRSIDNGVSERVTSFEELKNFKDVGSAFAISKAALYLSGFHPDFCGMSYNSLKEQLKDFGGGFEISLLAAIPKGSGLGTSSIFASTIFGALDDFCSQVWDKHIICHRTLILEQLLTTGGGWQDQYGGILHGIKLLESQPGIQEKVDVRWMPDNLFRHPEFKDNWLLYYTGVTRVAKTILVEIVRGMFLNEGKKLRIIDEIKQHAYNMAESIQKSDYQLTGKYLARSWKLNNLLDQGTNTSEIQRITDQIEDLTLGFKLLGAGGGGYMLIAAKDPSAAAKIQTILTENPVNRKARFVKMDLSTSGFQVSRS